MCRPTVHCRRQLHRTPWVARHFPYISRDRTRTPTHQTNDPIRIRPAARPVPMQRVRNGFGVGRVRLTGVRLASSCVRPRRSRTRVAPTWVPLPLSGKKVAMTCVKPTLGSARVALTVARVALTAARIVLTAGRVTRRATKVALRSADSHSSSPESHSPAADSHSAPPTHTYVRQTRTHVSQARTYAW